MSQVLLNYDKCPICRVKFLRVMLNSASDALVKHIKKGNKKIKLMLER
jgi:hypothetical protein